METPNRIVLPAMDMNVSEDGEIEQAEIDHYVARAKGGAGLIITGGCAIVWQIGPDGTYGPAIRYRDSDDLVLLGAAGVVCSR